MNVKYNYSILYTSIKYKYKSGTCVSTSVLFTLSAFVQQDKSESGESFELSRILVLSILAHPLIICFAMMVYSITLSDLNVNTIPNYSACLCPIRQRVKLNSCHKTDVLPRN